MLQAKSAPLLLLPALLALILTAGCAHRPAPEGPLLEEVDRAIETGDMVAAERLLRRPLRDGDAEAQLRMARIHAMGGPVLRRDDAQAREWYRRAAEQGLGTARIELADLYVFGNHQEQQRNYVQAAWWYRQAADAGDVVAAWALGRMYRQGLGVPQSDRDAAGWLRQAAEGGHVPAKAAYAWLLESGQGVTQDYGEALRWYRAAVDGGHAFARLRIGDAYRSGAMGLEADAVKAHMWYNLSATDGNSLARSRREQIAATMTPEEIARAQQMARQRATAP